MLKLLYLFIAMARAGLLGYGGGPSSVPLIQNEVVNNFHWMTTAEFGDVLALGNALPGPIATKLAGYVGYKIAGVLGAAAAVLGMVLPTVIAMMILYRFLTVLKDNPYVGGMVKAIKPVVIAMLLLLILQLWPSSMKSVMGIAIGVISFGLMYFFKANQAIIVLVALVFGAVFLH